MGHFRSNRNGSGAAIYIGSMVVLIVFWTVALVVMEVAT